MRRVLLSIWFILAAGAALANPRPTIDTGGFNAGAGGGNSTTNMNTNGPNEVIVAAFDAGPSTNGIVITISSVSGCGLTWTRRAQVYSTNGPWTNEEWWAPVPSTMSSCTVTVTWSGGAVDGSSVSWMAIAGAYDIYHPFDPNLALPYVTANTTESNVQLTSTLTTTNVDNLVISMAGSTRQPIWMTSTSGSGNPCESGFPIVRNYTAYSNAPPIRWTGISFYSCPVNAAFPSGTAWNFSTNTLQWGLFTDAVTSDPPATTHPQIINMQ